MGASDGQEHSTPNALGLSLDFIGPHARDAHYAQRLVQFAEQLGMIKSGVARVKVTVVGGKGKLGGC